MSPWTIATLNCWYGRTSRRNTCLVCGKHFEPKKGLSAKQNMFCCKQCAWEREKELHNKRRSEKRAKASLSKEHLPMLPETLRDEQQDPSVLQPQVQCEGAVLEREPPTGSRKRTVYREDEEGRRLVEVIW